MNINYTAVIGLIAGACTTISLLPQVIKTFKTRETKDISMAMYIILISGMLLWIIYGVLIEAPPVILANALSMLLALIILIFKIKYG
ncbi:MAG: SemiSWEET transporter [Nitrospirae bacterium]|nr:SemiSWEET transporter [Nitrospirota bacterium]